MHLKLLVVGDIHGTITGLQTVLKSIKLTKPDLLVVCGDITNHGLPQGWVKYFFTKIIDSLLPNRVRDNIILAVPGNCDPETSVSAELNALQQQQKQVINLHRRCITHYPSGLKFVGIGGSNLTPFCTDFEITEATLSEWLKPLVIPNVILVTHTPPKGILDRLGTQDNLGSSAIAEYVKVSKPRLVLSAHVHEARGSVRTGATVFVNPGAARDGYSALVKLKLKAGATTVDRSSIEVSLLSS